MPAAERTPLSDRVYDDLANRIRKCEIKPGQMIFEAELASHYDVSKTPVREALHRLIEEGLVEKYARAGYVVNQIGIRDVYDGYYVRELLEGNAAYLAAKHVTEEELKQLETLLPPDPVHLDDNREFHMIIANASRNQRLAKMVRTIYDDVLRITMLDPYLHNYALDGLEEHIRVYDALKAHDSEAARRAMVDHVQAGLHRVLGRL